MFLAMLGMGALLSPQDFLLEVKKPRGLLVGFGFQWVLVPLIAVVLGDLLPITAGIAVGLISNKVLMTAYNESFEGFTLFVFTLPSILTVMVIVSAIAFFAGVLPAIRASRLHPIESLRYE